MTQRHIARQQPSHFGLGLVDPLSAWWGHDARGSERNVGYGQLRPVAATKIGSAVCGDKETGH
jgi:hypothetical protein